MERAHRCLQLGYCGLPYGLGQARALPHGAGECAECGCRGTCLQRGVAV